MLNVTFIYQLSFTKHFNIKKTNVLVGITTHDRVKQQRRQFYWDRQWLPANNRLIWKSGFPNMPMCVGTEEAVIDENK